MIQIGDDKNDELKDVDLFRLEIGSLTLSIWKVPESLNGVHIAYMFLDSDLLPSVEKALIEWFKPALNNSQSEKKRQRVLTPNISDEKFDEMIEKLKAYYGIENFSELITRIVIDAAKANGLIKL